MNKLYKQGGSIVVEDGKRKRVYPKKNTKIKGNKNSLSVHNEEAINDISSATFTSANDAKELIQQINTEIKEPDVLVSLDNSINYEFYLNMFSNKVNVTTDKYTAKIEEPIEDFMMFCRVGNDGAPISAYTWNIDTSKVRGVDWMMQRVKVINLGRQFKLTEDQSIYSSPEGCEVINVAHNDETTINKLKDIFKGTINVNVEQDGEDNTVTLYAYRGAHITYNLNLGNEVIYVPEGSTKITFKTDAVSLQYMFMYPNVYDAMRWKSIDTKVFDVSNVTDMGYMFGYCKNLEEINLSSFDTSNVTSMQGMFKACHSIKELDLSTFNTSNVTDMSYMFEECSGLTSLDLSMFDTSKVTTMNSMFQNCKDITELDLSNFNTSNVTDMRHMFYYCTNLETLNVSGWDISKITGLYASTMLGGCTKLKKLILGNVTSTQLTFWRNRIPSSIKDVELVYTLV